MYLFNPDNDLALADFGQNYTSPISARKMGEDLALLPVWYADNENVVAESGLNRNYLAQLKTSFPILSNLISFSEIGNFAGETIKPWGWNPALRKRLLTSGVNEPSVPSMSELEKLRDYSSRKHAVKILKELKSENPFFCGESHYFIEFESLMDYLSSFEKDKFLKMPLSGSGKGIIRIIGAITDKQQDWSRRVISRQGGVVAEPVFYKVQDLAMEFCISEGKARFVAFSLFSSAVSGAYTGNELLSESKIRERLSQGLDLKIIDELITTLEIKLSSYFPHFIGFLGVDMMICRLQNRTYSLHPCVEINMRMNMGLVAHLFRQRFVNSEAEGHYRIQYFNQSGQALSFVTEMQKNYPLIVENGKIVSGFLALTAVGNQTQYIAFVLIA